MQIAAEWAATYELAAGEVRGTRVAMRGMAPSYSASNAVEEDTKTNQRHNMTKIIKTALVGSVIATIPFHVTQAIPITLTAFELIQDLERESQRFDDGDVNLQRVRDNKGAQSTENSDYTITSQNSVDKKFGVYGNSDVTYSHVLSWLTHGSLTSASLIIGVDGASGRNDFVIALDPRPDHTFCTSLETGLNTYNIDVNWLVDDTLNVKIDKNVGDGSSDKLEIYSSKLLVTWIGDDGSSSPNGGNPVPDGGSTLALMGLAMIGLRAGRRIVRP